MGETPSQESPVSVSARCFKGSPDVGCKTTLSPDGPQLNPPEFDGVVEDVDGFCGVCEETVLSVSETTVSSLDETSSDSELSEAVELSIYGSDEELL